MGPFFKSGDCEIEDRLGVNSLLLANGLEGALFDERGG
jgi:hypothetical protein